MAQINPLSTTMRLKLSKGEADGKVAVQSLSITGLDAGIDADTLLAVSQTFGSLAAHPVVETRRNDSGILVE